MIPLNMILHCLDLELTRSSEQASQTKKTPSSTKSFPSSAQPIPASISIGWIRHGNVHPKSLIIKEIASQMLIKVKNENNRKIVFICENYFNFDREEYLNGGGFT
jgi:hypothetical protein